MERHRTICEVLTEIQDRAAQQPDDYGIFKLAEEALTYARRMSTKLTEYKHAENTQGKVVIRCKNHVAQIDGICNTCGLYVE